MSPNVRAFGIVPAAGQSVRMGRQKLLLPWGNRTVIEHTLAMWQSSQVAEVIVVVSPNQGTLADLARSAGAHVVVPDAPPPEMKISVQHGLQFVASAFHPSEGDAWLLAPADSPLLNARIIDQLIRYHVETDAPARKGRILVPQHEGRHGHPVLFPWTLATHAAGLGHDETINTLVQRGPTVYLESDDAGVLADIDTPADYERLRPRTENK